MYTCIHLGASTHIYKRVQLSMYKYFVYEGTQCKKMHIPESVNSSLVF